MPKFIQPASQTEDAQLSRRLLRCLPATQFEMQTITRLASIVSTHSVPTASVECKRRPRMLINPSFVAENCPRDEHLFLLVMHELWHVLLAHTRMYPFSTRAHNIAFDAVINAGLMAKFNTAEYMGFFDKLYAADEFPACLLRPPKGWPQNPQYPSDENLPRGTRSIVERLYPARNYRRWAGQKPLYEEILRLLLDSGMDFESAPLILLGDHTSRPLNPDGSPVHDPLVKEAIKAVASNWKGISIDGQAIGQGTRDWQIDIQRYENARRVFSNVLQQALSQNRGKDYRRAKVNTPSTSGQGVIPNAQDRLLPARRALGMESLLYAQRGNVKARLPERPAMTHVYLDVSGSMSRILPSLLGLLIPYVNKGQISVYQFSTEVSPLPIGNLTSGKVQTTGGTNINCVLAHMLNPPQPLDKVLLLTDGEVGAPTSDLAIRTQESGVTIYAVLPYRCRMNYHVMPLVRQTVELPPAG